MGLGRRGRVVAGALLLATWLPAAGCGGKGKLHNVEGTLLYEDGTPVEGATVTFMPVADDAGRPAAAAQTDSEGRFKLVSPGGAGCLAGTYKPLVTKVEQILSDAGSSGSSDDIRRQTQEYYKKTSGREGTPRAARSLIPPEYGDVKASPLQPVTVPAEGPVELRIRRLPPQKK